MDNPHAATARLVSSKAREADLWRIVPALGMAQIVSWGSLYYAIAVLGDNMQRDLGVGPVMLYGAFTASLVLSGFAAPYIGRTIDARGGGTVLPFGSVIAGIAMLMLAAATGPATLIAGWLVAGLAMSAVLYDPAFATLTRIAGPSYRTAITALTLFGGLASTVFWPASQYLLDAVGWRQTLVIYGALHLLVCLPIHAFLVPRQTRRESTPALPTQSPATPAQHGFLLLAIAFALSSFVFSALSVHLISMLKADGLDAGSAVWIAAIIGPMQVMGRVGEFAFGRGMRPSSVGAMALGLLLIAILLLMAVPGPGGIAIGFAIAYGCSNGIMTISRGTVPAQLFGREGYGELLGRFARVVSSATAAAPIAVALLLSGGISYAGIKAVLALCLLVALPCYWIALRQHRAGAHHAALA